MRLHTALLALLLSAGLLLSPSEAAAKSRYGTAQHKTKARKNKVKGRKAPRRNVVRSRQIN